MNGLLSWTIVYFQLLVYVTPISTSATAKVLVIILVEVSIGRY